MSNINEFIAPKTAPRFLALDIDETFVVDDEEVYNRNKKSFRLLRSKGIVPLFCTSRCYVSAMTRVGVNFVEETGYNGFPGVYANGCCVLDDSGEAVFFEKFSIEFLDKFVKYMCHNKIQNDTYFETINRSLILEEPSIHINKNVQMKTMHKPELSTLEEVYKSDIISIRYITNGIEIPDLECGKDYVRVVYGNIVTLNPPGVTKHIGLKKLLKHYNVNPRNCAYIGDGENDIPGFELCETSFVVGNAKDEVKQKAKWVLDLNYDQGAFEKAVKLLVGSELNIKQIK